MRYRRGRGHLVIGHDPHVLRGVKVRPGNDAAIRYSPANLLFCGGAAKDGIELNKADLTGTNDRTAPGMRHVLPGRAKPAV